MKMPCPTFPETTFRSVADAPPIRLPSDCSMLMPSPLLGLVSSPEMSVPIQLPAMVLLPPVWRWMPSSAKSSMTKPLIVVEPAVTLKPCAEPAENPLRFTSGVALPASCVVASMVTGSVIVGSAEVSPMLGKSPPASMLNVMVSGLPTLAFEALIASRRLQCVELHPKASTTSFSVLTTSPAVTVTTDSQTENSDVLPAESVAVAVTPSPAEVAPRPLAVNDGPERL